MSGTTLASTTPFSTGSSAGAGPGRASGAAASASTTVEREPARTDRAGGDVYVGGGSSPAAARFAAFGGGEARHVPLSRVGDAAPQRGGESQYWRAGQQQAARINDHGFDFEPRRNEGNGRVSGEIDGPLSHNGSYRVTENTRDRFRIQLNVGADRAQREDLDVTMTIENGRATVTGSVKGKPLDPEGVNAPVTGSGTKRDPYCVRFTDASNKTHTLTWRPD